MPDFMAIMIRLLKNLLPSDVVNISFVSFLLVLSIAFSNRVERWYVLVPLYISMLIAAFWLVYPRPGNPRPRFQVVRRWYPLVFIPILFFSLQEIVHHILPHEIDEWLIELDYAIFGVHPTVFLSRYLNPYLVDVLELCYASFYWLPVFLAFSVYHRGRMREFETVATAVCLGFYLSYIGNMLFPVQGPHYTLQALHTVPVEGKWIGSHVRSYLFSLEPYKWDCFPSGHTAITLIVITYCYRYVRRLFWIMLPVAIGLIVSTVFLQHHYVVDVIAGSLLAGIVVVVTDLIQRSRLNRADSLHSSGTPEGTDSA
jgi:membrane-associated phospholipid phosphatase